MEKDTILNAMIFIISCIMMTESIKNYNKFDTDLWHIVCNAGFLVGLYVFTGYRWLV